MNSDSSPRTAICREALRLGFSAVRIAPIAEALHANAYEHWIANGFQGEMAYMARDPEKRIHPERIYPGASSAVVVALNYYQHTPDPPSPLHGEISRYARGIDYHSRMWDGLNALLAYAQEVAGPLRGRGYVDTAPILERDLAVRSGLGWIGRNTCLITPGTGSWYFLGELLLDIELEPDSPIADHCGRCRRCLDACPTGAFVDSHVLDARRCISYLTIELKGPIPRELRRLIGHRIFGCDICQEVCPHNKWAALPTDAGLCSDPAGAHLELLGLLTLNDNAFRTRFRGTPIQRIKRRGLLRNVCVALGNSGDRRAVSPLGQALQDPEPLIRAHAAWALGRLGGTGALGILTQASNTERDPDVLVEIHTAIPEAGRLRDVQHPHILRRNDDGLT